MKTKEIISFFIDNIKNGIGRAQLKPKDGEEIKTVYAKKVGNNVFEIKLDPEKRIHKEVSKLVLI